MHQTPVISTRYKVDCNRLRSTIAQRGHTLASFAKLIGVSNSGLSCVLKGANPSCEMMDRIAAGLGLTPQEATRIFFAPDLPNV